MAKKKTEVMLTLPDLGPRKFAIQLRDYGACKEAREFCKGKTLKQAWGRCRHHSWLLFYLRSVGYSINYSETFSVQLEAEQKFRSVIRKGYDKASLATCKFIRERVKIK